MGPSVTKISWNIPTLWGKWGISQWWRSFPTRNGGIFCNGKKDEKSSGGIGFPSWRQAQGKMRNTVVLISGGMLSYFIPMSCMWVIIHSKYVCLCTSAIYVNYIYELSHLPTGMHRVKALFCDAEMLLHKVFGLDPAGMLCARAGRAEAGEGTVGFSMRKAGTMKLI